MPFDPFNNEINTCTLVRGFFVGDRAARTIRLPTFCKIFGQCLRRRWSLLVGDMEVVLLSSPLRAPVLHSSSPFLPSPTDFLSKDERRQVHTSSNHTGGAVTRALATNRTLSDRTENGTGIGAISQGMQMAPAADAASGRGVADASVSTVAPRISEKFDLHAVTVVAKKTTKGSRMQTKIQIQTKIGRGSIRKPDGLEKQKRSKRAAKKTTNMNEDLPDPVMGTPKAGTPVDLAEGPNGLCLPEAMKRRLDWTPPKDTIVLPSLSDSSCGATGSQLPQDDHGVRAPSIGFEHLCRTFEFGATSESHTEESSFSQASLAPLTKRRRIEVCRASSSSLQSHSTSDSQKQPAALAKLVPMRPLDKKKAETKPKLVRKKAKTLTEQATARYAADYTPSIAAPLFDSSNSKDRAGPYSKDKAGPSNALFSISNQIISHDVHRSGRQTTGQPRGACRKPRQKRKAAKENVPTVSLLSPRSALKQMEALGVEFGTSSQLAKEQLPSNAIDGPNAKIVPKDCDSQAPERDRLNFSGAANYSSLGRWSSSDTSKSLWLAAARDGQGRVMDVVVDHPPSSSDLNVTSLASDEPSGRHVQEVRLGEFRPSVGDNQGWQHVDEVEAEKAVIRPSPPGTRRSKPQQSPQQSPLAPSDDEIYIALNDHRRRRQTCLQEPAIKEPSISSQLPAPIAGGGGKIAKVGCPSPMPQFDEYETTKLSSMLASYGFKPVKSRKRMILILEKCWEGKHRVALQTLQSNTHLSHREELESAEPRSPARQREVSEASSMERSSTRRRDDARTATKDTTTTFAPTVKPKAKGKTASAAASQAVPKPRRRKRSLEPCISESKPPSPARSRGETELAIDRSEHVIERASSMTESLDGLADEQGVSFSSPSDAVARQSDRFASITVAIRSERPSTRGQSPTWHEKMLMYDPIILEDLATWLNTQGLRAVGVDFEVGPAEVKAWCQAKSICCLWRENLRGGARRRY